MQILQFNDTGVNAFADYLDLLRHNPSACVPINLLDDPGLVRPLDVPIEAELRAFTTRMEFAKWLHNAARASDAEVPRRNVGFWSWLALKMFDQVCPARKGQRKVGEHARYIPMIDDWKRRYRHLLATPYNIFFIHRDAPERVSMILNSPLDVLGELTEQFASRQDLVSCPGTMALASYLFVDPSTGERRKRASGGAARRLGKLLNQYQRTWDITAMKPTASAAILPREFEPFRVLASESETQPA